MMALLTPHPQNVQTCKVLGLKGSEAHSSSSSKVVEKPLRVLSRNVTFSWRTEFWLFHVLMYVAVVSPLVPPSHPHSPPWISVAVEVDGAVHTLTCFTSAIIRSVTCTQAQHQGSPYPGARGEGVSAQMPQPPFSGSLFSNHFLSSNLLSVLRISHKLIAPIPLCLFVQTIILKKKIFNLKWLSRGKRGKHLY